MWILAFKYLNSGKVEIVSHLAVMVFNEGFLSFLEVLEMLKITLGVTSPLYVMQLDDKRIDCPRVGSVTLQNGSEFNKERKMQPTLIKTKNSMSLVFQI